MKTYSPKKSEIEREWFVVDAEGLTLGRMATEIARILRGKHKPTFAPHMDMGDHVIVVNAAKIHAALQWFLYVSSFKESTTCAETPKDCDSCWAYYSGGTERDAPIGLAAEIDVWAPETHDRVYDGVLAVRCWRDLDQTVPAADTAMQALAQDQLDFALLRGMGVLIRQYFLEFSCTTGNYQEAALEALRVLIPLFDRETRELDASVADLLESETANDAADVNVTAALDVIDEIYPCP